MVSFVECLVHPDGKVPSEPPTSPQSNRPTAQRSPDATMSR
jgi:hypothetical protein